MTKGLIGSCASVLGASFILMALSELVFLNEGPVVAFVRPDSLFAALDAFAVLTFFYLLPGAALIAFKPQMTSWPRVLLAGALVGWIIEGTFINAVYEAIPLSFLWTSVSWHAFFDVAFGWCLLRLVFRANAITAIATSVVFGCLWAFWATWPWPEVHLTATEFAWLALLSSALIAVGHWLADWQSPETGLSPWVGLSVFAIAIVLALLQAFPFLPWSLGLLALAALTAFALYRTKAGERTFGHGPRPSRRRYILPFLAGSVASISYAVIDSMNAGMAGGEVIPFLAMGLGVVFVAVLLWSLWHATVALHRV